MTEKDLLIQEQSRRIDGYKMAISTIEDRLRDLFVLEQPESISEMIVGQLIEYCKELKK